MGRLEGFKGRDDCGLVFSGFNGGKGTWVEWILIWGKEWIEFGNMIRRVDGVLRKGWYSVFWFE